MTFKRNNYKESVIKPINNNYLVQMGRRREGKSADAIKVHDCISETQTKSYLIVASHSVTESFVSHNLSFPIEEGQKTFLHCLQLLLVHLRERADGGKLNGEKLETCLPEEVIINKRLDA